MYAFLVKAKSNEWIGSVRKFADGKFYVKTRAGQSGWKYLGHAKSRGIKKPKGRKLKLTDPFQKQRDKENQKKRKAHGPAEFRVKALMAGSGVNAANYTGGRALSVESLQGGSLKKKRNKVHWR